MRRAASPIRLFGIACELCPVGSCAQRDDPGRACDNVDVQSPDEGALTHLSDGLPALLSQLDDFRVPDWIPSQSRRPLPPYIPQIQPRTRLLSHSPRTAALTLSEFVSARGRSYSGGVHAARSLREGGAATLVLVGTAPDPVLEAVWRRFTAFVDAVREAAIDLVLGPALSIYVGRLPIERNANRSRNLALFRELREAGLEAIPAVGFVDDRDASHVAGWLTRLGVHSAFVDLQSADTAGSWCVAREAVAVLAAEASALDRLIVNGVAEPARVIDLVDAARPLALTLTNGNAFQLARSGHDYFRAPQRLVKRRSAHPPAHIFENLSRFYADAVRGETRQYMSLDGQPRLL